jgi:hypothetical protein
VLRGGEPPPTDPMGTYLTAEQVMAGQQPPNRYDENRYD